MNNFQPNERGYRGEFGGRLFNIFQTKSVLKFTIMTTTLEAIYENGIFKPVSSVPKSLRENERVKIIIQTEFDEDLESEISQWEAASDEDFLKFEQALKEKS